MPPTDGPETGVAGAPHSGAEPVLAGRSPKLTLGGHANRRRAPSAWMEARLEGRGRPSASSMQEVDNEFCRRGRLFFRDPMPAIRDDHIFDVIGDTPHHRADH